MRHVSLLWVDMKHFKSFASAHVDVRRDPGLRMIFGENRREPRLGANGAGKSTIWDAVCFCLSGRSVRGKRLADLITTGKKTTEVSTGWSIDGVEHVIKRSGPPERVYIDGQQVDQAAVDALMGLSRDRFLASVLFGQARPLFIDQPAPERGDLLDQVLGLGFWMRAADLASSRWSAANVQMQKLQREVARLEGAIAELPSDESLRQLAEEHDVLIARQVEDEEAKRPALNSEYRRLKRAELALQTDVEKEDKVKSRLSDLNASASEDEKQVAVLDSEISRLSNDMAFFDEENGTCPTCGQEISLEFADKHIHELRADAEARSALIDKINKRLDSTLGEIDAAQDELRELSNRTTERHRLALVASSKRSEIGILDNRIQVLRAQVNPYHNQIKQVEDRRAELASQLDAKRAEEASLSTRIDHLDFWRQGFRRVRIFCLARVLSELEVETMSAARSLGLVGWHIGFRGETETKSGTVKLGIQATVQSPEAKRDFDSWSPGEGQRVRCASALGLASLIQRHSGVSYDLEVWDEPSAWLSAEGIDDLFECLRERAYSRGKSIWIVDPRAGLSHGGFDEVWNVVKTEEGSRVDIGSIEHAAH
jgi:DNA repair exonuclease SbcCD ATPase subunit